MKINIINRLIKIGRKFTFKYSIVNKKKRNQSAKTLNQTKVPQSNIFTLTIYKNKQTLMLTMVVTRYHLLYKPCKMFPSQALLASNPFVQESF